MQTSLIHLIRQLVECESPTGSVAAVNRLTELFAESIRDIADCRTVSCGPNAGRILVCRFKLPGSRFKSPGRKTSGRILALGHSDTVWPIGTLRTMPFRQFNGRLYGPGVLDMKAGLAMFAFAMRSVIGSDKPVSSEVILLVNPDEETGSAASRAHTEKLARGCRAVLVLEPGAGLKGDLKTARKGVGSYNVQVKGVAAHSGVDFANGASAVVELSRQITKIAGFTDLRRGVTVNAGVIRGGTRGNVIAAEADALIDIRVPTVRDGVALAKKFRSLRPFDRRCSLVVSGGLTRPPMERSREIAELFRLAQKLARAIGVRLEESATGGGSDGNFTAALGIPTLDGLGAVGEGAHAAHESVLIDRLGDRTALLASLISSLQ